MAGAANDELNKGLATFADQLLSDGLASKRVEVAVITFGAVELKADFATVENGAMPQLSAGGLTPMGAALNMSMDLLEDRKALYRQQGISYYRPWVFLITDGVPTDEWGGAAARIKQGQAQKALNFFSVGVQGADMETLRQVSDTQPLHLNGLDFRGLFMWLSNSMSSVSRSQTSDTIALVDPTTGPRGWATA
jgi:uncharacterized protein YegL